MKFNLTTRPASLILSRNQKNNMNDLITKDNLIALLRAKKSAVIEALNNKHVVYLNEGESAVKANGIRRFTIKDIDKVATGKSGRTYVTALVEDLDDGGKLKYRNLHLAGLELAWE